MTVPGELSRTLTTLNIRGNSLDDLDGSSNVWFYRRDVYVYVQCVLVARYMSPHLPVGCRGAESDSTEVPSSAGQLLVECPVFASSAQSELSC